MEILTLAQGFLNANCYLLIAENGGCAAVDPSCRVDVILESISSRGLTLEKILLTHAHFDHMMSAEGLKERMAVPLCLHESERDFPMSGDKNAFSRLFGRERAFPPGDRFFRDGDEISVGNETLTVLETAGHTVGSSCFYFSGSRTASPFLLTGDTLFAEGIGRTDLYSGCAASMQHSLEFLKTLPADTEIYPGHGEPSTLGEALEAAALFFEFC